MTNNEEFENIVWVYCFYYVCVKKKSPPISYVYFPDQYKCIYRIGGEFSLTRTTILHY